MVVEVFPMQFRRRAFSPCARASSSPGARPLGINLNHRPRAQAASLHNPSQSEQVTSTSNIVVESTFVVPSPGLRWRLPRELVR